MTSEVADSGGCAEKYSGVGLVWESGPVSMFPRRGR
jgi:hypothetical protein